MGGGLEEVEFGSCSPETMEYVLRELVAGQRGEMESDHDALGKRFVDGHRETAAQFGLSEQKQTKAVLGVHVVVCQKAEVLEHIGPKVMSLIDDEDGSATGFGNEPGDLGADLSKESGAAAFDGKAHLPGDGFVEVHDVAGGKTDVEHPVERGVKCVKHLTTAASFSASAVAGHEADAAQFDEMGESDLELLGGGGGKEFVGLDLVAEGVMGEGEVFAVHVSGPPEA